MSFIIKKRIIIEPTTQPPVVPTTTTTTTTTTTQNITLINDGNIFVGGFPNTFLPRSPIPMFDEFPATTGGEFGDVIMNITTNNTYLTAPTNGSYISKIFVDVVMGFTNTHLTQSRDVALPRLAIDLPTNGLTGVENSFSPSESLTKLRAYTDQRLVIEYDTITIPAASSYILTANGSADLVGSGTNISITNIEGVGIDGVGTADVTFDFNIIRGGATNPTLPIDIRYAYSNEIKNHTDNGASPSQYIYGFAPTTFDELLLTPASGIIRVEDVDVPQRLMDHQQNKKGYAEVSSDVTFPPSTTTTTTTAAPDYGYVQFVKNQFLPHPPPFQAGGSNVGVGDILEFAVETTTSNFGAVPYRIYVLTTLAGGGSSVGLVSTTGNLNPVGEVGNVFADGSIISQGTLGDGLVSPTITTEFLNTTTSTFQISLSLEVDENNNGNYIPGDIATYYVEGDAGGL